jgi:hypothetical protein
MGARDSATENTQFSWHELACAETQALEALIDLMRVVNKSGGLDLALVRCALITQHRAAESAAPAVSPVATAQKDPVAQRMNLAASTLALCKRLRENW